MIGDCALSQARQGLKYRAFCVVDIAFAEVRLEISRVKKRVESHPYTKDDDHCGEP
jgi:hypothetical protein